MLKFPKGFFEAEIRDDFEVGTTMKTVWAAEMEVLAAVAGVCEKYQLPWFADWGTALGAVRHKGFIPWDDDIDICMIRSDFERLMEVLPSELPEGWKVYNEKSGEVQEQYWSCVMNSDEISIEESRLSAFHGCPFVVGIDIFPLDYLPRDEKKAQLIDSLFMLIWKAVQLAKIKEPTKDNKKALKEAIKALERYYGMKFSTKEDLVTQLWRLANQMCASCGEEDGDYLVGYKQYVSNKNFKFKKEWFDDTVYLPFESVELPLPIGYDNVLTVEFGDYMTPIRGGMSHDYPFYNKQLEQLRNIVKEMDQKEKK